MYAFDIYCEVIDIHSNQSCELTNINSVTHILRSKIYTLGFTNCEELDKLSHILIVKNWYK